MPAVVHPFSPSPSLRWEDADALGLHRLKCGALGDFEDPAVDADYRRFLFREPLAFGISLGYVLGGIFATVTEPAQRNPFMYARIALYAVVIAVDGLFHFSFQHLREKRSYGFLRLLTATLTGVLSATFELDLPRLNVMACGDVDAIHASLPPLNATNATANSTAHAVLLATMEDAIADRQRYCIDVVDTHTLALPIVIGPLLHLLPQQGIPLLLLGVVCVAVGYLRLPDQADEKFSLDASTPIANVTLAALLALGAAAFMIHAQRVSRTRFVATTRAEAARRRASAKLSEVDLLLRSTMPPLALERLVAASSNDTPINVDTNDHVAVLWAKFSDFPSLDSCSPSSFVCALNTLILEFDSIVIAQPDVEKVKTVGDAYWALSGLPSPAHTPASALISVAVRVQEAAQGLRSSVPFLGGVGMKLGVALGTASASVVGNEALNYLAFGPACDAAVAAARECPPDALCVTASLLVALAAEADDPLLCPSIALFSHGNAVRERFTQHTGDLFQLPLASPTKLSTRLDTNDDDMLERASESSLPSRRVHFHEGSQRSVAEDPVADEWVSARVAFILRRAAEQPSQQARAADCAKRVLKIVAGEPQSRDGSGRVDCVVEFNTPDGPFATRDGVPFTYTFKDAAVEKAYVKYITAQTLTFRRFCRCAYAVFSAAVFGLMFLGPEVDYTATAIVGTGTGALVINAVLLVALGDAWPWQAEAAVLHCATAAVIVGLFLAPSTPVANDPTFFHQPYLLFFSCSTLMISALVRWLLWCLVGLAVIAKIFVVGTGDYGLHGGQIAACIAFLGLMFSLNEKYVRCGFVELRLAAALAAHQEEAHVAQDELLASIAPTPLVEPLKSWISGGFLPNKSVFLELPRIAVLAVRAVQGSDASPSWLTHVHRLMDDLLQECPHVKMCRRNATSILSTSVELVAEKQSSAETIDRLVSNSLEDFVRLLSALERRGVVTLAGVHVGRAVVAALGRERMTCDKLGEAVNTAQELMEQTAETFSRVDSRASWLACSEQSDVLLSNVCRAELGAAPFPGTPVHPVAQVYGFKPVDASAP